LHCTANEGILNSEELLTDLQNLVYIYQYKISESLKPSLLRNSRRLE
jgi:hypothetical protein